MENPARRLLALLRQLFKSESRKVKSGCHGNTVWRIAPARNKSVDDPLGDVDFIRIHSSRRPR